ncbi:MAG: hypothetical protein ACREP9_02420 [Candidatus Dormibacteraceae bacterium]
MPILALILIAVIIQVLRWNGLPMPRIVRGGFQIAFAAFVLWLLVVTALVGSCVVLAWWLLY